MQDLDRWPYRFSLLENLVMMSDASPNPPPPSGPPEKERKGKLNTLLGVAALAGTYSRDPKLRSASSKALQVAKQNEENRSARESESISDDLVTWINDTVQSAYRLYDQPPSQGLLHHAALFAAEQGLTGAARDMVAGACNMGYVCRKVEEEMFPGSGPEVSVLRDHLREAWADPSEEVIRIIHHVALAYAAGTCEHMPQLDVLSLTWLESEHRDLLRAATVNSLIYPDGTSSSLPPNLVPDDLLRAWSVGFVVRACSKSLPYVSGGNYGPVPPPNP